MTSAVPVMTIAAGIVFLVAAIKVLIHQRRIVEVIPDANANLDLPAKWDDSEITRLLQLHQDQPVLLSHAVSSIKARMILNQDLKTAQRRLKLVQSVLEVFKTNKELQGIVHELQLARAEFEIRQIEAAARLEDVHARQKSEQQLRLLRQQRDELQLVKEITQLRHETSAIEEAAKPRTPELTPEQQRAQKHAESEARIQKLKLLKQEALTLDDGEERVQRVNAIDDEIQQELEQWRRTL